MSLKPPKKFRSSIRSYCQIMRVFLHPSRTGYTRKSVSCSFRLASMYIGAIEQSFTHAVVGRCARLPSTEQPTCEKAWLSDKLNNLENNLLLMFNDKLQRFAVLEDVSPQVAFYAEKFHCLTMSAQRFSKQLFQKQTNNEPISSAVVPHQYSTMRKGSHFPRTVGHRKWLRQNLVPPNFHVFYQSPREKRQRHAFNQLAI